jgi:DNA-binding transcriptional ArsR family regulator
VLNSLRRPVLVLHHANRQGEFYGSVYVRNAARSLIEARKTQEPSSRVLHLGLFHAKANDSELQRPLGVAINFLPDATVITRTEIAEVPGLAEHLPLSARALHALRGGALTEEDLAALLDASRETVARTLRRLRERDAVVRLEDGRWGLRAP